MAVLVITQWIVPFLILYSKIFFKKKLKLIHRCCYQIILRAIVLAPGMAILGSLLANSDTPPGGSSAGTVKRSRDRDYRRGYFDDRIKEEG